MNSSFLKPDLVEECRRKLLFMKQDLLNRSRSSAKIFAQTRHSSSAGDEADQTVAQLEEHQFLVSQQRMRQQLFEIESALARISSGSFGLCEETEELIEEERLLAVPWTRLSIEGAEMREALSRKYVK